MIAFARTSPTVTASCRHFIWYISVVPADDATMPKILLVFYRTAAGNEPVRDWLKAMDRTDRLEVGADLQRVQYRWPVGMPLCRPLGRGLWEVRTELDAKDARRGIDDCAKTQARG
jgi:hypothetical protein